MIDVKPFSGRRPLFSPLLGAPSIHRLLRGADLPLRGLQPIARQIQRQDDAVMNQAVDGCRRRHRIFEDPLPLLIGTPWGLAQEGSARQRRWVRFRTSGAGNFKGRRSGYRKVAHQMLLANSSKATKGAEKAQPDKSLTRRKRSV